MSDIEGNESDIEEVMDDDLEVEDGEAITLVDNQDSEEEEEEDDIDSEDEDIEGEDTNFPIKTQNIKNLKGDIHDNYFNEEYQITGDYMSGGADMDDDEFNKFNQELKNEYLINFHPESLSHNYDEIRSLAQVKRNNKNIIVDDLHKTPPILSKFERTRILGKRTMQINSGHNPFVKVDRNVIDSRLIAEMELNSKKIPYIIRRTLPSGGAEYWYLRDLEIV